MSAQAHHSSRWRAAASPGGLIGLFLMILCVVLGVTAYLGITDRFPMFFSDTVLWVLLGVAVVLAVVFLFLFWGYMTIGYRLDAEALRINWGFWSVEISLSEIETIAPAEEVLGPGSAGWKPLWPGYYIARGQTEIGEVQVIATLPRRRQILIMLSDGRRYSISPERPLLFMEEFARWQNTMRQPQPEEVPAGVAMDAEPAQRFVEAGWTTEYSTHQIAQQAPQAATGSAEATGSESPVPEPAPARTRVYRSPPSSTSPLLRPILLRDPVALAFIVLGFLTTAAMAIYILVQYDNIPQSLTLHWNVEGLPGRVGEPREIWILPAIAGLVLLANIGLAWSIALFDRFAARLMISATMLVHIVTWIALLMIIQ